VLLPTAYGFAAGHCVRVAIAGADSKHFTVDHEGDRTLWIHTGEGICAEINVCHDSEVVPWLKPYLTGRWGIMRQLLQLSSTSYVERCMRSSRWLLESQISAGLQICLALKRHGGFCTAGDHMPSRIILPEVDLHQAHHG
jgi:hypothetical protein